MISNAKFGEVWGSKSKNFGKYWVLRAGGWWVCPKSQFFDEVTYGNLIRYRYLIDKYIADSQVMFQLTLLKNSIW